MKNEVKDFFIALEQIRRELCICSQLLTHSFPMHPFSTPLKTSENRKVFWCF